MSSLAVLKLDIPLVTTKKLKEWEKPSLQYKLINIANNHKVKSRITKIVTEAELQNKHREKKK